METNKNSSLIDKIVINADEALRAMFAPQQAQRINPADDNKMTSSNLSDEERKKSIELMRVNHVGEVCAQALYQGQAMTAKSAEVKEKMQLAAEEEIDHLSWCGQRLDELGSRPSYLNPVWYCGSFAMGAIAGAIGDKWSLGFLAETETQVEQHLAEHLDYLPENDHRSRAIVEQMKIDEAKHAQMANDSGAADLPLPVKTGMKLTANLMKKVAAKI